MRGKTLLLAVAAVLSVLCATAVAGDHRVVKGTAGGDELTMSGGADRVFARAGDDTVDGGAGNDRVRGGHGDDALFGGDGKDRLRGGQDNDLLDGGDGNDRLNGGGDGGDKDRIVCGDGYDVVVLGKNDVVLVEVGASGDGEELEKPERGDDDGCEKVRRPGGDTEACGSTGDGCERESCASTGDGCEPKSCASTGDGCEPKPCASRVAPGCYPGDEVCAATNRGCDDPVVEEPEPDPAVEEEDPGQY